MPLGNANGDGDNTRVFELGEGPLAMECWLTTPDKLDPDWGLLNSSGDAWGRTGSGLLERSLLAGDVYTLPGITGDLSRDADKGRCCRASGLPWVGSGRPCVLLALDAFAGRLPLSVAASLCLGDANLGSCHPAPATEGA